MQAGVSPVEFSLSAETFAPVALDEIEYEAVAYKFVRKLSPAALVVDRVSPFESFVSFVVGRTQRDEVF